MAAVEPKIGRRERNKQDKLDRITAAASELFALHGVDEVTTQQIADEADIGAGTLFLYAKNKGELLLLVQNAHYAEALVVGKASAAKAPDVLSAVMAIITPVIECNRVQVENGRTYLREMAFGDAAEPHHRDALELTAQTEEAIAEVLVRSSQGDGDRERVLAHIVSAVMFMAMASPAAIAQSVAEIADSIEVQIAAILER